MSAVTRSVVLTESTVVLLMSAVMRSVVLTEWTVVMSMLTVMRSVVLTESTAPYGFEFSRIEPLSSPACRKRRLMKASRGLPAGAISSVMKV